MTTLLHFFWITATLHDASQRLQDRTYAMHHLGCQMQLSQRLLRINNSLICNISTINCWVDSKYCLGRSAAVTSSLSRITIHSLQNQTNLCWLHFGTPPVVEVILQVPIANAELQLLQKFTVLHEI